MVKKKQSCEQELEGLRPHIPEIVRSLIPNGGTHQRFMLYIHGVAPFNERLRYSVNACRNALRRLLREALYRHLTALRRQEGKALLWEEWSRYKIKVVNEIIKELEQAGIVEYRAIDLAQQSSGIVGI